MMTHWWPCDDLANHLNNSSVCELAMPVVSLNARAADTALGSSRSKKKTSATLLSAALTARSWNGERSVDASR